MINCQKKKGYITLTIGFFSLDVTSMAIDEYPLGNKFYVVINPEEKIPLKYQPCDNTDTQTSVMSYEFDRSGCSSVFNVYVCRNGTIVYAFNDTSYPTGKMLFTPCVISYPDNPKTSSIMPTLTTSADILLRLGLAPIRPDTTIGSNINILVYDVGFVTKVIIPKLTVFNIRKIQRTKDTYVYKTFIALFRTVSGSSPSLAFEDAFNKVFVDTSLSNITTIVEACLDKQNYVSATTFDSEDNSLSENDVKIANITVDRRSNVFGTTPVVTITYDPTTPGISTATTCTLSDDIEIYLFSDQL
jgi:hypothetical protein